MREYAQVFYIPLGVETYESITRENIEDHFVRYGRVNMDEKSFIEFMEIINGAENGEDFNETKVRAKIEFPDHRKIFIDSVGKTSNEGRVGKISSQKLEKMTKLIEKITNPRYR